jgi:hypothetical protein
MTGGSAGSGIRLIVPIPVVRSHPCQAPPGGIGQTVRVPPTDLVRPARR